MPCKLAPEEANGTQEIFKAYLDPKRPSLVRLP